MGHKGNLTSHYTREKIKALAEAVEYVGTEINFAMSWVHSSSLQQDCLTCSSYYSYNEDAISDYKKQSISPTSDGYGSYPHELLLRENQKVWDYLNELEGVSQLDL